MRKTFLTLLTFATLFGACKEDNAVGEKAEDYLIFGTFYGFCAGNCTVVYKIDQEEIFEDDVEYGVPDVVPFLPTPLSDEDFELASELVSNFPSELIESDKETYGCPDCADQGGVYLEMRKGTEITKWYIDNFDDEQSQSIIDYKVRVREIVQILN